MTTPSGLLIEDKWTMKESRKNRTRYVDIRDDNII